MSKSDVPPTQNDIPDSLPEQDAAALDETISDDAKAAALDLEHDLDSLKCKLQEVEDRVLRSQAELENYRKRVRRERDEERQYAGLPLLRDLLPVVDNIERAIAAAEQADQASGLLEGFRMVASLLSSILAQHHCQPIDAAGASFDPHLHEAISQQPSQEHPDGTVLHVTQIGYTLHDRVVRPSQVVVSRAVSPNNQE